MDLMNDVDLIEQCNAEVWSLLNQAKYMINYRDLSETFARLSAGASEALYNHVEHNFGARILEIGPARGGALTTIHRYYEWTDLYGLDINTDQFSYHNKTMSIYNIQLIRGDAQFLPFVDNFFDFIISCFTLHYVPDKLRALSEIHRVLRPTGVAYINMPLDEILIDSKKTGYTLFPAGVESDIELTDQVTCEDRLVISKKGHPPNFKKYKFLGINKTISDPEWKDDRMHVISLYEELH